MLWPTWLTGIPILKPHNREAVINLSKETFWARIMENNPGLDPGHFPTNTFKYLYNTQNLLRISLIFKKIVLKTHNINFII